MKIFLAGKKCRETRGESNSVPYWAIPPRLPAPAQVKFREGIPVQPIFPEAIHLPVLSGRKLKKVSAERPTPTAGTWKGREKSQTEGVSWLERGGCRVWSGGEGEGLVGKGHVDTAAESGRDWGQ